MKKNILIIAYDGMNKSGVPGVIMEIINGLSSSYHFSLVVFENIESDFYYSRLKELNVEIINCDFKKANSKIRRFYDEYKGFHNFTYKFFDELFRNKKFDVVHSFKEGDSSGIFKAAKRNGIQLRIWHTTVLHEYSNNLMGLLSKHKLKLSLKYATTFVGGSGLSCQLAFKRRNFKVITNCYKTDVYSFIPSNCFENLEMVQIGYFSDNKNQLFTLEVCKIIKDILPTFKMHFIGFENDKNYLQKIKNKISNELLENNIVFHNFDANQIDVFKKCSYSLMPSKREGFSLTLIEAQACGLKCFASSSIPTDANAGGVTYLDLSASLWADRIIEDFKKTGGKHTIFNMKRFGRTTFLTNIKNLYK